MVVLHSNSRILSAALSLNSSGQSNSGFSDQGRSLEPMESAWEVLAHKYNCSGATFLDSEALSESIAQVASVRPTAPATDHFYAQLVKLREARPSFWRSSARTVLAAKKFSAFLVSFFLW
jgi:hypothetical protein